MQTTQLTSRKRLFVDKSFHFTSLGCSKNLVDSQVMLGHLGLDGFKITTQAEEAEIIIVNTCSFIEASKRESIDTILDLADNKQEGRCQALVVSGCMAQRYAAELEAELPEVDLIIGTGEYNKIVTLLKALEDGRLEKKSFVEIPKFIHTEYDPRVNTSPFYMAWLKVSEGCNRNCTFCIIPTIRGRLRSRTVDSLYQESKRLVESGVKELNIISQDLSDYGVDMPEGNDLYNLISKLEEIPELRWVRLFYYYPDELTEKVMQKMAESPKVVPYLDMPVQHFSDSVLKRMNRKITGDIILDRIQRLRSYIPNVILRTSIIVGFPGETEEDFQRLLAGIKEIKFNHLGIFRYSDEEGTPAFKLQPKVDQETIDRRFDQLYEAQKEVVTELNQKYLGQVLDVLIEGNHEDTELLVKGRHAGQAPDIDGNVLINDFSGFDIKVGDIVRAKVTQVLDYDLVATVVP